MHYSYEFAGNTDGKESHRIDESIQPPFQKKQQHSLIQYYSSESLFNPNQSPNFNCSNPKLQLSTPYKILKIIHNVTSFHDHPLPFRSTRPIDLTPQRAISPLNICQHVVIKYFIHPSSAKFFLLIANSTLIHLVQSKLHYNLCALSSMGKCLFD